LAIREIAKGFHFFPTYRTAAGGAAVFASAKKDCFRPKDEDSAELRDGSRLPALLLALHLPAKRGDLATQRGESPERAASRSTKNDARLAVMYPNTATP
jgi:hypothetical protein